MSAQKPSRKEQQSRQPFRKASPKASADDSANLLNQHPSIAQSHAKDTASSPYRKRLKRPPSPLARDLDKPKGGSQPSLTSEAYHHKDYRFQRPHNLSSAPHRVPHSKAMSKESLSTPQNRACHVVPTQPYHLLFQTAPSPSYLSHPDNSLADSVHDSTTPCQLLANRAEWCSLYKVAPCYRAASTTTKASRCIYYHR